MSAPRLRPRSRLSESAGGSRLVAVPSTLAVVAARQYGVFTRGQLENFGFGPSHVRAAVAARRWSVIGRRVVVLHNSALSTDQRLWAAVLMLRTPAGLAGLTAATYASLRGFAPEQVQVLVPHDTHVRMPTWVRIHESRRFASADVARRPGPPRTSPLRSLVDGATWSAAPRRACAVLCAGVQQRLVTARGLTEELRRAGPVRHVGIMRQVLGDISGGGHTLAEIDLGPLALRAGLDRPRRQVLRREPGGRVRYVDAEFDLPDGTVLTVEVDGAVHLQPQSWWDDTTRQNEIVIAGRPMLRFPSINVRLDKDLVVDQLRRMRLAHPAQRRARATR